MDELVGYDPQGRPIWGMKLGKVQKPYQLHPYQLDTIREIKKCLKLNRYSGTQMIRDHLDVLAGILGRISWAVSNEDQVGYDNISSKNDLEEIKRLYCQLKSMLY
jgi:hypothetical protein